jgi:hypothetical protein
MGGFALWFIMIAVCVWIAPAIYSISQSLKELVRAQNREDGR